MQMSMQRTQKRSSVARGEADAGWRQWHVGTLETSSDTRIDARWGLGCTCLDNADTATGPRRALVRRAKR